MYIESSQESGEIVQRPIYTAYDRVKFLSRYRMDMERSYFASKTKKYNPTITNDTLQRSISYVLKNPSLHTTEAWSNWDLDDEHIIIRRPKNEMQFKLFMDFLIYCSIVDKCWNAGNTFDVKKTLDQMFRFLSDEEICQHEIFLIQYGIEYDF
jgi:hypothetical protein